MEWELQGLGQQRVSELRLASGATVRRSWRLKSNGELCCGWGWAWWAEGWYGCCCRDDRVLELSTKLCGARRRPSLWNVRWFVASSTGHWQDTARCIVMSQDTISEKPVHNCSCFYPVPWKFYFSHFKKQFKVANARAMPAKNRIRGKNLNTWLK